MAPPRLQRAAPPARPRRPWSVTTLGILLFGQAGVLLWAGLNSATSLYLLLMVGREAAAEWGGWGASVQRGAWLSLLSTLSLLPLAALTLLAASGLLRLRPTAWLYAMFVQGVILATTLVFYVNGEPDYLTMAFSVFIVFYLNYDEIQQIFRALVKEAGGEP